MPKCANVDWEKIKNEYITNPKVSYHSLSEKYGIAASAINRRGKEGKWKEKRERFAEKSEEKTIQKLIEERAKGEAKRLEALYRATDELTEKISKAISKVRPTQTLAIRQLAASLKEIRSMENDLDIDERRARIDKLRERMSGGADGEEGGGVLILPEINQELKPPDEPEGEGEDGT